MPKPFSEATEKLVMQVINFILMSLFAAAVAGVVAWLWHVIIAEVFK